MCPCCKDTFGGIDISSGDTCLVGPDPPTQSAPDVLDADLITWEHIDHAFPLATIPAKRNLLGAFDFPGDDPATTSTSTSASSPAASARVSCWPGCSSTPRTSWSSTSRPTTSIETKEMLVKTLAAFDGTMLFVSHDRAFLRGLATRVLDLSGGGEGIARKPLVFPGDYQRWVERTGHEAPGVHR